MWASDRIEIAHVRKTATQHGFCTLFRAKRVREHREQVFRSTPNRVVVVVGGGVREPLVTAKGKNDTFIEGKFVENYL